MKFGKGCYIITFMGAAIKPNYFVIARGVICGVACILIASNLCCEHLNRSTERGESYHFVLPTGPRVVNSAFR